MAVLGMEEEEEELKVNWPQGAGGEEAAHLLFSTALLAYSIWNTLPSGENWAAERSYCRKGRT